MRRETAPPGASVTLKHRLQDEVRKYLLVSAYLYVCFGAIQLFKAAVLRDAGIDYLPFGFAAAKALILGKFLLLGDAAHLGTRLRARTLLHRIAHRVVLLMLMLIVLVVVEELAVGMLHGRAIGATLSEYGSRVPEVLAMALMMLLILVPLVATSELDGAMRPRSLMQVLREPLPSSHDRAEPSGAP